MIVANSSELLSALQARGPSQILVQGRLCALPSMTLRPGQCLGSESPNASIEFIPESDGLRLTTDNSVRGLSIKVSTERRAIFNDTGCEDLGHIELRDLHLHGQLQLLARDKLRSGHIEIDRLRIDQADTRLRPETVTGNGVEVLQGALTIWNQQRNRDARLSANLRAISIGSRESPVLGSGVFLSGSVEADGGRLDLEAVNMVSVVADSGLAEGTTHQVAAAVFVSRNAHAHRVRSAGPMETFGPNCVVLDNWGTVEEWIAESGICSHGSSAIAVVNVGTLRVLRIEGLTETFGRGARGMSIYADTGDVSLESLTTHGDGAAGIHVTRLLKSLRVAGSLITHGGMGRSLVKGVTEMMTADAIDVVGSGHIGELQVLGSIVVHGEGAAACRKQP